jgi:hypothetical protein
MNTTKDTFEAVYGLMQKVVGHHTLSCGNFIILVYVILKITVAIKEHFHYYFVYRGLRFACPQSNRDMEYTGFKKFF